MSWNAFDLNLLTVFDAVVQEKNLTRAGQRLGMSQPAVSHALARLRHVLKTSSLCVRPRACAQPPRAADGWTSPRGTAGTPGDTGIR
jgi:DNA-binding transcriptional LysR family regulator